MDYEIIYRITEKIYIGISKRCCCRDVSTNAHHARRPSHFQEGNAREVGRFRISLAWNLRVLERSLGEGMPCFNMTGEPWNLFETGVSRLEGEPGLWHVPSSESQPCQVFGKLNPSKSSFTNC